MTCWTGYHRRPPSWPLSRIAIVFAVKVLTVVGVGLILLG
jgi:hypothetical protein